MHSLYMFGNKVHTPRIPCRLSTYLFARRCSLFMARGLILSSSSSPILTANSLLSSFSKTPSKSFSLLSFSHLLHHHHYLPKSSSIPLSCCFSVSSSSTSPSQQCSIDMSNYRQAFSKRMDMAGIKPHHRIG
jgi:hypothetical protein